MAKSLIIVESSAKAKTIKKYLGRGYDVVASVGHVKDLARSKKGGLRIKGIDIDNDFKPTYVVNPDKAGVLKDIKAKAKLAEKIYLASDPDREGEMVAWHIAEELRSLKNCQILRARFTAITKLTVKKALEEAGEINERKVNAQQARRVLDRVIGFPLSDLLGEKVQYRLSAGRVQSVVVRLICEREREREAFNIEEYWTITALLKGAETVPFLAKLHSVNGKSVEVGKPGKIATDEQATAIVEALKTQQLVVTGIKPTEKAEAPNAPFITSRLQQDASTKLRFSPSRTMMLAQQLYAGVNIGKEGLVGLITYMRTDSTRISDEATAEVRTLIGEKFGSDYVPEKPPVYKQPKAAQEGHEAIRPTDVTRAPDTLQDVLSRDHYRLYELIWQRFVASQMTSAKFNDTRVDIAAGVYLFRATGRQEIFAGHRAVYREGKDLDSQGVAQLGSDGAAENILPALAIGDELYGDGEGFRPKQHFTQPPPRYTEARLIRVMEEKGIGRPSTYTSIVSKIQEVPRQYVEQKEQGRLQPTERGMKVNDLLVEFFPEILDVTFTAAMEERLDQIEGSDRKWFETVRDYYLPFDERLKIAKEKMQSLKQASIPTDISCEKCGASMVIKWGKNGQFLGCSLYPECKHTSNFTKDAVGSIIEVPKPAEIPTDEICEQCGSAMVVRTGRFGKFLGCIAYDSPTKCGGKKKIVITLGVKCPEVECDGDIVEKRTKKGNRPCYGCNRYPKCKFFSWDRLVSKSCPSCGAPFLMEKSRKQAASQIMCRDTSCGYTEDDAVGLSSPLSA
tara:strand:+ start:5072 stop:7447 length:2376 start_codon:yes stop_codon:yes gene_type:complete